MEKQVYNRDKYLSPTTIPLNIISEGVLLTTSPVNPGYGGNEDMEEGDDL